MAQISWKAVLIIALITFLLYNLTKTPLQIPLQAILNVEQDKTAAIIFQIITNPTDKDTSDGNYTRHEGSYRIISTNGTFITAGPTEEIDDKYSVTVNYAPRINSSVIAEILERVYRYNESCACIAQPNTTCIQVCTNTSTQTGQGIIASQKIDIAVVQKQEAAVVVTTTTSSGGTWRAPVPTNTPVTPVNTTMLPTQDVIVSAPEGFWDKYGLYIVLSLSFIVLGLALLQYFGGGRLRNIRKRRR